jgi:outer membrane biosynthesis protein TonB
MPSPQGAQRRDETWQGPCHALPYGAMASESVTPPPSSGGSAKYLVVILLLLGGGLGVFFAMRKEPETAKVAPPPKNAAPSTAMEQNTVELPVEEPEVPDAGIAPEPPKRKVVPAGDPWACAGDITPTAIRRVLGEEQAAVRSCYERQLRNNNMLQGDIKLQVRVGNDGKVSATRVGGNLKDADVKNCVQNVAKNWSFPAPSGGTCAVFEAPFHFTPKQ